LVILKPLMKLVAQTSRRGGQVHRLKPALHLVLLGLLKKHYESKILGEYKH
jgi:hypothetical protein